MGWRYRKTAALIAAVFSPFLFLIACGAANSPATGDEACLTDFQPGTDYFPDKIELRHAIGFSVSYHDHYKVLTIGSSSGDQESDTDVLVLVQCGAPAPPLEGDLAGATLIGIPALTIGANEDLSLNRVRALGFVDRVIAMGSEGLYAPELRARWENGEAVTIGSSFHGPPNYEKLLSAPPDVLFLSTASIAPSASIHRARELGLAAVPSLSWMESSPLGQAEWLHLVAVFLNAEATSIAVFDEIETNYLALSQAARRQPTSPMVVWLDPVRQRDQWSVPQSNWMAQLVTDAGGRTPWTRQDFAETRIVTSEQILALGDTVEIMVTTSVGLGKPGSTGSLEAMTAIASGRLFDVHRRSRPEHDAYDWYESGVVEVDLVLADFVALLHPELLPDHTFVHLRPARPSGETEQE